MARREELEGLLTSIVDESTKLYGDGTPFFDAVDRKVTRLEFFDYLRDRILDEFRWVDGIVTSGKFGWAFSAYAYNLGVLPKVLNFPGNLRHDFLQDPMIDVRFQGQKFVFLDNSIYKGRTLGQIQNYVQRWGGQIVFAHVIYDGSRPQPDGLHEWTRRGFFHDYLYRWHEGGFRP